MTAKRIVICADGTWNRADQLHPTNVFKLARAIPPVGVDGRAQVVFYDAGVGTGNLWDHLTGGAFGEGLRQNVEDANLFIALNYVAGDEIYLVGFSRGAYTARSTAGMIRKVGVLRKEHLDRLPEAYRLYRGPLHPDAPESQAFRRAYAQEAPLRFIGVWDTVGALGIPISGLQWLTRHRHQFHDVQLSRHVENGFHAVAIDEQRRPFRPTLWVQYPEALPSQRVEQRWFPGVHSDVGGGYRDAALSDLALLWLTERAIECGLTFDRDALAKFTLPSPRGTLHHSRRGLFRLFGRYVRPIGNAAHEVIDASALERHRDLELRYAPANLVAFLRRNP